MPSDCSCTKLYLIQYAYKFETELDQYSQNYQPNYFYFISDTFYLDKGYSKCINK